MMVVKFAEFNFSASELSEILDELLDSDNGYDRTVKINEDTLRCMRAMAILCNKRIDECNASLHRADELMKELEKRVNLGKSIISRLTDKELHGDMTPVPLTAELAKDICTFYSGT